MIIEAASESPSRIKAIIQNAYGLIDHPAKPGIVTHFHRDEIISSVSAAIGKALDFIAHPDLAGEFNALDRLEVPYQAVRIIDTIFAQNQGELSPESIGNLNEIRTDAVNSMGTWYGSQGFHSATRSIKLVEKAMRNAVFAANEATNKNSLRNLIYAIEGALAAKPSMAFDLNIGGSYHQNIARRGAWVAVFQHTEDGKPKNAVIETILFKNFRSPYPGYIPPTQDELAMQIPPKGLSVSEALDLQQALRDQALGNVRPSDRSQRSRNASMQEVPTPA